MVAAAVAAVSAEAEIIQMFLGKPADESAPLELDETDEFADEAMQLAGVDACDPEVDPCQVYGLVSLDASGDDMAVVNLGLWDELREDADDADNDWMLEEDDDDLTDAELAELMVSEEL